MFQEICPLCDTQSGLVISNKDRRKKPLNTACCQQCGFVFNTPIPDEEELCAFYRTEYRCDYKNTKEPKLKHHYRYANRFVDQIAQYPEPYRKAGSILDIGSGSGEFVALMAFVGISIEGIEPTEGYARYVEKTFKVPVFNGSMDDFSPDDPYDFIRLNHVLEHLADPVERLRRLREWLSDDGVLHVEVPDFRSYCRSKSPGNMFHYGHIYNYDSHTLRRVTARAGFEVVFVGSDTSVYLKKCKAFEIEADKSNAELNMERYRNHMRGVYRSQISKVTRLFSKLVRASLEKRAVKKAGNANEIIALHGKRLKARL